MVFLWFFRSSEKKELLLAPAAYIRNRRDHHAYLKRLGQMRVHAGLLALFHILKEGVCGQRLRPVRTGSCVDSPIKVVTLYSSILLKPFQAYFEFLAIIQMRLNL